MVSMRMWQKKVSGSLKYSDLKKQKQKQKQKNLFPYLCFVFSDLSAIGR